MSNPNLKDTNLKAILGPTNTGKTFYAMERMLSHDSGMIGFPLRLLARENYDKVERYVQCPLVPEKVHYLQYYRK